MGRASAAEDLRLEVPHPSKNQSEVVQKLQVATRSSIRKPRP